MAEMFNRNSAVCDNDDIYLDTLREQSISLAISLGNPNTNSNSAAGS